TISTEQFKKCNMLDNEISDFYTYILDRLIQDKSVNNIDTYELFTESMFNKENILITSFANNGCHNSVMNSYSKLFSGHAVFIDDNTNAILPSVDRFILWGTQFNVPNNRKLIKRLLFDNTKKYAIAELGFITRVCLNNKNNKYNQHCAYVFDDIAPYYDARYKTRLEEMLNDKNLVLSSEQKRRARECINFIVKNHLTKYNHQPIYEPDIGRAGVVKVLVVDQSYGDMSILKGLADEGTFHNMLHQAINENPNADIIVKTHPDTLAGSCGYYTGLKQHDNIYPMIEAINPISIINYVDKVYVCSSQFGFEALMCGKEVHTFGMPFYAGWGLTVDEQKCERRTNKRTLEEMFYISYIMYSHYVNPEKQCRCEIEEAMDYLLRLRDEYFSNI
ncbi:MAG: hypothetical protein LUH11_00155, partial [Candidatus Gastranaerophilales bacterium]|nr:hypothetical protein [Candidatus Gastranaerophilales bacterium]